MPKPVCEMDVATRLLARCEALAALSETPDGLTRTYLSPQHQAANRLVGEWMREAGMTVWQDGVGNICGRYEGQQTAAPAVLIGSHLDTVRNAGKYDGMLGVVLGVEVVAQLHARGERLPFAIEVVGFGDEEGVRFGITLLGSRGLSGGWPPGWLAATDRDGVSLAQALIDFGLAPERIGEARRDPASLLAYLEAHIEQGPCLEQADLALGVVTAINGAKRLKLRVTGVAGHAGTVPMGLRQDALAGAAEFMLAVEQLAQDRDIVATVGQLSCQPGAVNVIPDAVNLSLDIRAAEDRRRDDALDTLLRQGAEIAARRGLTFEHECFYSSPATPCAPSLQSLLAEAVTQVQGKVMHLPSGAGHDAMAMAEICPVGMLFVRCTAGISHHPAEAVRGDDLALALQTLVRAVSQLAGESGRWARVSAR